jgi:hypothetical protein
MTFMTIYENSLEVIDLENEIRNQGRQAILSEFYVTIKPDGRSGCTLFVNALTIARWLQIGSIQT